jgi:hypothetical protein
VNVDTTIEELEAANPVGPPSESQIDAAWLSIRATLTSPTRLRAPRRTRRVVAAGILVAALVGVVVFQALPSPETAPTAASAAPFLRQAARAILTAPTFDQQSAVVPQANQYVYSETEDPSGTLVQTWLSVDGNLPEVGRWTSGIKGEVPASGATTNAACTVAQAESSGCIPEAGYLPDLPTDPTALLSYLSQISLVDTVPSDNSTPGQLNNDLASAVMYLMQTCYVLPAQQAALFTLMAQTPGYTIVPQMSDVIGRVGVGVEWSFTGDSGALIFNPTTYALLGERTWPGPPVLSAPYDGDALLGVSIVNSIPPGQTTTSWPNPA